MRILVLAAMALGVSLTGCSYSNLQMARTLDKGHFQIVAAPAAITNAGRYSGAQNDSVYPQLELSGRYGVTDQVEVGVKAWLLGGVVDGKFSLLRSDGNSGMDVSIDPGLGLRTAAEVDKVGIVQLPVLIGFNFGGNQLILAPKLVDEINFANALGHTLFVGSSFGYSFKLGNNFRIMPEVTVMYPLMINTSFTGSSSVVAELGLGLIFGG